MVLEDLQEIQEIQAICQIMQLAQKDKVRVLATLEVEVEVEMVETLLLVVEMQILQIVLVVAARVEDMAARCPLVVLLVRMEMWILDLKQVQEDKRIQDPREGRDR